MSAPTRHVVLPDGYCETCGTVPCSQPWRPATPSRRPDLGDQLDRIELKLNRLLRANGLEPETTSMPEPETSRG